MRDVPGAGADIVAHNPVPDRIWRRFVAWVAEGCTGTVTFGVAQGHVKDYEIREFGKVEGCPVDKA